jgi:hypothetical protein
MSSCPSAVAPPLTYNDFIQRILEKVAKSIDKKRAGSIIGLWGNVGKKGKPGNIATISEVRSGVFG